MLRKDDNWHTRFRQDNHGHPAGMLRISHCLRLQGPSSRCPKHSGIPTLPRIYLEWASPAGGAVKSNRVAWSKRKMEKLPPRITSPGRSKRGLFLGNLQPVGPNWTAPEREARRMGNRTHSDMPARSLDSQAYDSRCVGPCLAEARAFIWEFTKDRGLMPHQDLWACRPWGEQGSWAGVGWQVNPRAIKSFTSFSHGFLTCLKPGSELWVSSADFREEFWVLTASWGTCKTRSSCDQVTVLEKVPRRIYKK
jgi:hypothetical protein